MMIRTPLSVVVLVMIMAACIVLAAESYPPGDFYSCQLADDVNDFIQPGKGIKSNDLLHSGPWNRIQSAIAHANIAGGGSALPCLHFKEGWWEYEYCHGRWLRQFHIEKGAVVTEYILGVHPNAIQDRQEDPVAQRPITYSDGTYPFERKLSQIRAPLNSDAQYYCSHGMDSRMRGLGWSNLPRTVVSQIGDGTKCDTGVPRLTRVTLTCDHKEKVLIGFNVTEFAQCQYLVFLVGTAACDVLEQVNSQAMEPRRAEQPGMTRVSSSGKVHNFKKTSSTPPSAPSQDSSASTVNPIEQFNDKARKAELTKAEAQVFREYGSSNEEHRFLQMGQMLVRAGLRKMPEHLKSSSESRDRWSVLEGKHLTEKVQKASEKIYERWEKVQIDDHRRQLIANALIEAGIKTLDDSGLPEGSPTEKLSALGEQLEKEIKRRKEPREPPSGIRVNFEVDGSQGDNLNDLLKKAVQKKIKKDWEERLAKAGVVADLEVTSVNFPDLEKEKKGDDDRKGEETNEEDVPQEKNPYGDSMFFAV